MEKITLEKIKSDKDFRALIDSANNNLEKMGYTEHGLRHVGYVSRTTANILRELGYDDRIVELGAITGLMSRWTLAILLSWMATSATPLTARTTDCRVRRLLFRCLRA